MQLKCKHFEESYKSIKPLKQQNFVKYKNIKIRSEIILAARQTFEPFDDDFFRRYAALGYLNAILICS